MKKIKRERIYIIPTRFGLMYAGGILVTVLAGTIYTNNLVYMLCFFLVALFLIGMVQTHANMRGLKVDRLRMRLVEEGSHGKAILWLNSINQEDHHLLLIKLIEDQHITEVKIDKVEARAMTPHSVSFFGTNLGPHIIRKVQISTVFPFGMFKAWKSEYIKATYYVYPKPEGNSLLPISQRLDEARLLNVGAKGEDYSQHRKYEIGEPQRHVDWKAFAKGRPMLIKEFKDGQRDTFEFVLQEKDKLSALKLRQVSKWIDICHKKRQSYSIKMGSRVIVANSGQTHKENCLEALSVFGSKSA